MKIKYYRLNNIKKCNAKYNVIFGQRSNGKTYAVLEEGIKNYISSGKQLAIIRRWDEDFKGKRGRQMFDSLTASGAIAKLTGGVWTGVYYFSSTWFLCRYEENGDRVTDERPFCYGFSLTAMEHDKSTSYPNITTVLFDEFLTRTVYLPDEFILFTNVLSTIIRERDDVIIYMLGNTVNKYCPYFAEMGLKHVKEMKPGDIDIYQYGDGKLKVAVEYTEPHVNGKKSDVYFAFDNPKLKMITTVTWEIDVYPHCPEKYKPKDILFTFFIEFDKEMLQCEVVMTKGKIFTFIHKKTTELKRPDKDLIYSLAYDPRPNWKRNILKPCSEIERKVSALIKADKIFYADNDTGEIMRNYLNHCKTI